MQFQPDFDLYQEYENVPREIQPPYVAVFRKGVKTLVCICERHQHIFSFDIIDWVFDKSSLPPADVFLVERENDYDKPVGNRSSLLYAAAIAAQKNIPIVFFDLSAKQMIAVLGNLYPDQEFTPQRLHNILTSRPVRNGTTDCEMIIALNRYGRDKFMIQNIAAALNKYDTVYVIFGEEHFRSQRQMLIDMLGKPEYINRNQIPQMRRDFSGMKINPIKLIDFNMGDDK